MTFIEGFIVPVPQANRDAYRQHASDAFPIFNEFGVRRLVEAWGDDVPQGKVTDFRMAVNAKEDEQVVFSFFEYPDRATRDAANEKMRTDPRMKEMGETMPFDGKRMVYGGFEAFVEEGRPGGAYVDGFVLPVAPDQKEAYRALAQKAAAIFLEHGALRDVEAWAVDVPKGEVTDFYRAVKAKEDEIIVFSFIEWPDKQTRDEGWKKVMADERMKPDDNMPFDGQRMFWGGFERIVDTSAERAEQSSARIGQPA
jgi:uncharacterized protein YbaA (DUF1428 family)